MTRQWFKQLGSVLLVLNAFAICIRFTQDRLSIHLPLLGGEQHGESIEKAWGLLVLGGIGIAWGVARLAIEWIRLRWAGAPGEERCTSFRPTWPELAVLAVLINVLSTLTLLGVFQLRGQDGLPRVLSMLSWLSLVVAGYFMAVAFGALRAAGKGGQAECH